MKFLVGVGVGIKPSFDSAAGTLTFDERIQRVEAKDVLLIVNCSTNQILHNSNNVDLEGDWDDFGNSGLFNLVLPWDAGTMADTDEIHAWVELRNGVAGIDFLSDLAIKSQTYAALNDIDISLEGDLNIDMGATNDAIDLTNQYIGDGDSEIDDGTVTGELKGVNNALSEMDATHTATNANMTTLTNYILASAQETLINHEETNTILTSLNTIPESFVLIDGDTAEIGVDHSGAGGPDLSGGLCNDSQHTSQGTCEADTDCNGTGITCIWRDYTYMVNLRSLDTETEVTVTDDRGPMTNLAGYSLEKDDFLDIKCVKVIVGSGAGTTGSILIHVI